ncbi:MAG: GNAT family N-acetyltransferase, partial [Micavibrio sp.]|nr:GNAT family N-acetyltransferase [Micavibrio sp.]
MHKVAFLNGFLATYYLDRGPVWYEGFDKEENFLAFARTLKSDLPTGFLKSIRFIPEIPASPELIDEMKKIGFKHKRDSAYETSILDLTQKTEVLRRNLKANWRNQLKKSEAHDLTIEFDLQEKYQNWLERTYLKDKMLKKYKGPSLSMIKALFKSQNENDKCLIVRVLDKGRPVSGALFILHPPSATYQIGFSMEQGRKINANNFLLWNSALYLKERGIKTLDLGGMNDKDAKS